MYDLFMLISNCICSINNNDIYLYIIILICLRLVVGNQISLVRRRAMDISAPARPVEFSGAPNFHTPSQSTCVYLQRHL